MSYQFRLIDLIDIERLQALQNHFSKAMSITIVIVDESGIPVVEPNDLASFCQISYLEQMQKRKCFESSHASGSTTLDIGESVVYRCYCGLVEIAAPLIVRGQYLGAFLLGHVRVEPEKESNIPYIVEQQQNCKNKSTLTKTYEEINFVPYERLIAAANLLSSVTNDIAEQGYINNIQKELHAKSIKLAEEQRNLAQLEHALRDAEYKALTYQINPHFLFNVLNTIGKLAFLEDAQKTEDMVYLFSDMMRYILKKGDNKLITIGSEVNSIRSYLAIQQIRMKDRFTYEITVPEKYFPIASPFLILQPLVENCFNYVVEPREVKSHITIRAYDDGKTIFIEIIDNGDGISPEKISFILSNTSKRNHDKSIGIQNVQSRLKLLFGDSFGLEIESDNKPNHGTTVRLRLPMSTANT